MRYATLVLALGAMLAGCQSIGSGTLVHDRRGYAAALGESWKEQMLLNIVKQRYLDLPVYLDVSGVISSYSYQAQADLGLTLFPRAADSTNRSVGVSGQYTESPTVSFSTLTGEQLATALLRPLPPETLFALMVAGRRAETLMRAVLLSVNGIRNAGTDPQRRLGGIETAPFSDFIATMGALIDAGALGLSVETNDDDVRTTYVHFDDGGDERVAAQVQKLRSLLKLKPDADRYVLAFGTGVRPDRLAVVTRSMQQLMSQLAAGVDVPASDVQEGRVTASSASAPGSTGPLLRVSSGTAAPPDAYAKVQYRDSAYWIEDRDLTSKRMFVLLMMLWSLAQGSSSQAQPVLTLPLR